MLPKFLLQNQFLEHSKASFYLQKGTHKSSEASLRRKKNEQVVFVYNKKKTNRFSSMKWISNRSFHQNIDWNKAHLNAVRRQANKNVHRRTTNDNKNAANCNHESESFEQSSVIWVLYAVEVRSQVNFVYSHNFITALKRWL